MATTDIDAQPDRRVNKFYFIAWRGHFYAGLYVIPFLIVLAITGLTMLWFSWGFGVGGERTAVTPGGDPIAVAQLKFWQKRRYRMGRPHSTSRPCPTIVRQLLWLKMRMALRVL